jgi:hypothetical protein
VLCMYIYICAVREFRLDIFIFLMAIMYLEFLLLDFCTNMSSINSQRSRYKDKNF